MKRRFPGAHADGRQAHERTLSITDHSETWVKTANEAPATPRRAATSGTQEASAGWGGSGNRHSRVLSAGPQGGAVAVENAAGFLEKLKIELPSPAAISLLGPCPKNPNTGAQRDVFTLTFAAVLFSIAKMWTKPKCPSAGEWISETRSIPTMQSSISLKK